MITQIVDYLNSVIQAKFPQAFGKYSNIIELQQDGARKVYRMYEMTDCQENEIQLDDSLKIQVYHRTLRVDTTFPEPERARGKQDVIKIVYQNFMVISADRCIFQNSTTAEIAAAFPTLFEVTVPKDVTANAKLMQAIIKPGIVEVDRVALWRKEMGEDTIRIPLGRIYIGINYQVLTYALRQCFDLCKQCE